MPSHRVMEIVTMLARYLRANPLAADTPDGIALWWLGSEEAVSMDNLQEALNLLVHAEAMLAQHGADGRVRYRLAHDASALDGPETAARLVLGQHP